MFPRRLILPLLAALAAALAGCARDQAAAAGTDGASGARGAAPPAEFLVAAGDSTFWVRTTPEGIRVRGTPMLLARWGGRFYEVYVADDDRSFYDAVFIGQRVYRRDLVTGDSALVFQDGEVPLLQRRYAAEHPDEAPLEPDEDASDHPSVVATADVQLVDLHGPYLSYEYHADIEQPGADDRHTARRGVVDLRTGRPVTVARLFGDTAAARILAQARDAFEAALDSIRADRDPRDGRARDAADALAFDPRSFAIVDVDRAPAVEFAVPGRDARAQGAVLTLDPVAAPAPAWWAEVRASFPEPVDSLTDAWPGSGYTVLARYAAAGDTATLVLRDARAREWRAGRIPAPAHRVFWLDRPRVDSAARHALARAFDESVFYSDDARSASLDRRHRVATRFRVAGLGAPARRHRTPHPHA